MLEKFKTAVASQEQAMIAVDISRQTKTAKSFSHYVKEFGSCPFCVLDFVVFVAASKLWQLAKDTDSRFAL